MNPLWTIRPYCEGDEAGILDLFNRVFSEEDARFKPRTLEHWNWQFRDNPLSHHTWVAEDTDSLIVGNYTSIPGVWIHEGEEMMGSQAVDTCVDGTYRRSLKKEGLFLSLAGEWFDHYGRPDQDRIVYGFPNPVAYRIGTRRLDYRPVHVPVRGYNRNFAPDWIDWLGSMGADQVEVDEVQEIPPEVDALFEDARQGLSLVQRRDVRYLDWRYRQCPGRAYRFLTARSKEGGGLRGLLVMLDGWMDHAIAPLVDWVIPGEDTEAVAGLVRHAAHLAGEAGSTCLDTWVPPWSAHARALERVGFAGDDSSFNLCIRVFGPSFDENWAREHWFFTMGDSDVY